MSTIKYCDMDDCRNTQEDCKVYDLDWNDQDGLPKLLGLNKYDNVCSECIDMVNSEYEHIKPIIFGGFISHPILNSEFKE